MPSFPDPAILLAIYLAVATSIAITGTLVLTGLEAGSTTQRHRGREFLEMGWVICMGLCWAFLSIQLLSFLNDALPSSATAFGKITAHLPDVPWLFPYAVFGLVLLALLLPTILFGLLGAGLGRKLLCQRKGEASPPIRTVG